MALDLLGWMPFRFLRGSAKAGASSQEQWPDRWPSVSRLAPSKDPFVMLPEQRRRPSRAGGSAGCWFGDFSPHAFRPHIDVVDDGPSLRITAELPGVEARDLFLRIADGFLMVRGEKRVDGQQDEKGCYRLERAFGSFRRVLPLPGNLDVEHAEARFSRGVLTLRVPKRGDEGKDSQFDVR